LFNANEISCIEFVMREARPTFEILLATVLCVTILHAGTPGSFRGKIVTGPHAATEKNWIYIEGRNGMVRRVDVSHAEVGYDEDVVTAERLPKPQDGLIAGVEVRVTAEQGTDGEWRAGKVEILKVASGH
jgi:hypothetical protein